MNKFNNTPATTALLAELLKGTSVRQRMGVRAAVRLRRSPKGARRR